MGTVTCHNLGSLLLDLVLKILFIYVLYKYTVMLWRVIMKIELTIDRTKELPKGAVSALEKEL
jgi:hypothetical protein